MADNARAAVVLVWRNVRRFMILLLASTGSKHKHSARCRRVHTGLVQEWSADAHIRGAGVRNTESRGCRHPRSHHSAFLNAPCGSTAPTALSSLLEKRPQIGRAHV